MTKNREPPSSKKRAKKLYNEVKENAIQHFENIKESGKNLFRWKPKQQKEIYKNTTEYYINRALSKVANPSRNSIRKSVEQNRLRKSKRKRKQRMIYYDY